jgi:hypothetical protein
MPPAELRALDRPVPGLYATPPAPLPFLPSLDVRSFVLERDAGTVVVYNSPGLTAVAPAIGTPALWVVNHEHEAMFGPQEIGLGVHVHERDRAAAAALPIDGTFSGRETLGDDFEVIPTPGHTPGTTTFRWDSGRHRFLFTGDALWFDQDGWRAAVLGSSDRAAYLESLALIRELDFDVLVPWAAPATGSPVEVVTRERIRDQLDAVIGRVAAGESS